MEAGSLQEVTPASGVEVGFWAVPRFGVVCCGRGTPSCIRERLATVGTGHAADEHN